MSGRVLAMRGGALGDFVLGLPALAALRGAFPTSRLEMIAPRAVLPLAAGLVDSSVPIELAENSAFFGDEPLPSEMAERYEGLDLAVVWMADTEGAIRRQFERLGTRRIISAPALPPKDTRVHATDYLLGTLARGAGILTTFSSEIGSGGDSAPPHPVVHTSPDAVSRATDIFERLAFAQGEGVVAIHPGSGGRWKCWPAERFARAIDALAAAGRGVVLIQGPADEEVVAAVLSALRREPPPIASDLGVDDLAALLSLCGAYLGNDSGVTHLAAAVGVPTVALFGPTDPAVWGPRGDHVTIVRGEQGRLDAVTVEQVLDTLGGLGKPGTT